MLSSYGMGLSCALLFPCIMMIFKFHTLCLILLGSTFVVPAAKNKNIYDAVHTGKYVPDFQTSLLVVFDYPEIDSTFLRNDDN